MKMPCRYTTMMFEKTMWPLYGFGSVFILATAVEVWTHLTASIINAQLNMVLLKPRPVMGLLAKEHGILGVIGYKMSLRKKH